MGFEWKYIPAIKKKPCLSASCSRLLQGLSMSLKAFTKPEISCFIPGSSTNWSLLPVSKDLQEPLLQSTSCQTHQPPRILPKTLSGKPQPWFLRARLWEELPSSCWPPGQCLPDMPPSHVRLTHYCTLLLGRHRHAEPTSGQQWKRSVSTDGGKRCAQEQELYS